MNEADRQMYDRIIGLYKTGQYDFIEKNWIVFPDELKDDLILRSFEDGNNYFSSKSFLMQYGYKDLARIKNEKARLSILFDLNEEKNRELYFGLKGRKYNSKDKDEEYISRTLGVYSMLKNYELLTKKYSFFTPEIVSRNYNLLKCDYRRTESRINFLYELYNGEFPQSINLSNLLTDRTVYFNMKYRREIEKRIASMSPGTMEFSILTSFVNEVPDYAYDKFLEISLRAIYGDEKILKIIEEKKKEIIAAEKQENILEIDELFDGAFPVEHSGRAWSTGNSTRNIEGNNSDFLDEEKINEFLIKLAENGITCEGYINAEGGTKSFGQKHVRYYILNVENYKILEPLGQVGNSTIIMKNNITIDEMREKIQNSSLPQVIRDGFAIKLYHTRTDDNSYQYSVQRIKNIQVLMNEFLKEKSAQLTLAQIRSKVTKIISREEVEEATEYLWDLGKNTSITLFRNLSKLESRDKENEEENLKEDESSKEIKAEDEMGGDI